MWTDDIAKIIIYFWKNRPSRKIITEMEEIIQSFQLPLPRILNWKKTEAALYTIWEFAPGLSIQQFVNESRPEIRGAFQDYFNCQAYFTTMQHYFCIELRFIPNIIDVLITGQENYSLVR